MSIENQSNMMQWIATSERLPEIDTTDIWNNDNKISKDVLCYSSKWGITFGRYFHVAGGFWSLNGITSSDTIIVEYWMDVIPPKKTKKILKAKKHLKQTK